MKTVNIITLGVAIAIIGGLLYMAKNPPKNQLADDINRGVVYQRYLRECLDETTTLIENSEQAKKEAAKSICEFTHQDFTSCTITKQDTEKWLTHTLENCARAKQK